MKHEILQIDALIFNKVRGYKLVDNKIISNFYNITNEVQKQIKHDMETYKNLNLIYGCTIENDEIINVKLSRIF